MCMRAIGPWLAAAIMLASAACDSESSRQQATRDDDAGATPAAIFDRWSSLLGAARLERQQFRGDSTQLRIWFELSVDRHLLFEAIRSADQWKSRWYVGEGAALETRENLPSRQQLVSFIAELYQLPSKPRRRESFGGARSCVLRIQVSDSTTYREWVYDNPAVNESSDDSRLLTAVTRLVASEAMPLQCRRQINRRVPARSRPTG